MTSDGYSLRNRVKLVRGGDEYFTLLHELVSKARRTIHLQFYIFDDDETGTQLKEALINASRRGVDVFLHADGYASQVLSRQFIAGMKESGIRFKWFEPLFKSRKFYFGRRMHHKVVVVDGIYSMTGGINISNRYNDMSDNPAWMDLAIFCEGEASLQLHNLCRNMWGKPYKDKLDLQAAEEFFRQIPAKDYHSVRVRRNDWVKRKNEVTRSYFYMFHHAEKEIIIMCSYFLPGRAFRRAMSKAVKRGVKIKTILAGPSDVMIAKHAERYLYDWLLKNNIEIYEYQKTVLHAKTAVYDSRWVTAGSYNVNNISAYASLEINLDIRNKPFALHIKTELEKIIRQDCRKITPDNYISSTRFFRRLWQRLCFSFINTMLSLFTFYFKQEE
ncbi:MAG: phospholipase [Bacteroidetes bacterium]|nr:phospholipase [Bacteroidota bacterium]